MTSTATISASVRLPEPFSEPALGADGVRKNGSGKSTPTQPHKPDATASQVAGPVGGP